MGRTRKVKNDEKELSEDSPEISALKAKVAKLEEEKATSAQKTSKMAIFTAQVPGSGFAFGAAPFSFANPSQGIPLKPNYFKKQRFSSSFLIT